MVINNILFVCINGCEVDDKMDYMSKVQYTWESSNLIKNRTMADSSEKMTLRSSIQHKRNVDTGMQTIFSSPAPT